MAFSWRAPKTVLRYNDRASFLYALLHFGYREKVDVDVETGPLPSDSFDSDVTDREGHLVGAWWQTGTARWEGELASEGVDEWLRYTHSHDAPTETEMLDEIRRGS